MEPSVTAILSGWGRYPREESIVYRPEKRSSVLTTLRARQEAHYIARGLGRSYGDASVNQNSGVIAFDRMDRMLRFDPATGVLECEAGVSLESIIDAFLPRGYFLPVTPGTKFITIGGAIANDVHGKNHHRDGTFGQSLLDFTLLTPNGSQMTCSRGENSDVFWATLGGVGLTGMIMSARFSLQPVESAYITVDYKRCSCLDEVLAAISESDAQYQYSVAWVDCLARGRCLGRSVLMRGNHAPAQSVTGDPYAVDRKRELSVPFDFPGFVLNPLGVKAFNTLFYARHRTRDGVLVDYDSYFYPLDAIHQWNRMYGKRGFIQYQATFPLDQVQGLEELLQRISKAKVASFLAVLKRFGKANRGYLSYPFEGYTLTLDIPYRPKLASFLHELDALLLQHGGRLYLAKDAVATPETIAAMYPRLPEFKTICSNLDPDGVLSSSMARRLGLVKAR